MKEPPVREKKGNAWKIGGTWRFPGKRSDAATPRNEMERFRVGRWNVYTLSFYVIINYIIATIKTGSARVDPPDAAIVQLSEDRARGVFSGPR
jgi:hypothetical protein